MENSEVNDYPPANAIEEKEKKDYPILRCEDCREILRINLKLDKKEVQLKCEKEGKTRDIPFENFFTEIKKYEEINCCEFCKNTNTSQNYYLCKTCSNKILCENCFEEHNKKDDVIKFKIDSTCKKHYYPYESYCPICKENKCSYCSIDHDESHEKEELFLKKKLFKKNKLDEFKNTIMKIKEEKNRIELKINSVTKELEEKIKMLNELKIGFFESLNMKLKFVELVLDNYEKKIKDLDVNFAIINNLEKQINFNLTKLDLNYNDSLDKKIGTISNFLNKNLNSHFNFDYNESKERNQQKDNIWGDEVSDVYFEKICECKYDLKGILDLNKYLLSFYSSNSIYIISKANFNITFIIKEFGLEDIQICKKIDDDKILIHTSQNIAIIKILNSNDYMLTQKIDFSYEVIDFNSSFDLLYLKYDYDKYHYTKGFSIELLLFPNYKQVNFSFYVKKTKSRIDERVKFLEKNIFLILTSENLASFIIKNNICYLQKKIKISINYKNALIDVLNNEFFYINDGQNILLLNKSNLVLTKTINLNMNNLGILKITDRLVTIFASNQNNFVALNCDILSNGIKWNVTKTINLLNNTVDKVFQNKNFILCRCNNYGKYFCVLFEIQTK